MKISWRRFAFFKKEALAEDVELGRRVCGGSRVISAAYGGDWIILGLESGVVRAVDTKDVENVRDIAVFRQPPVVSATIVDDEVVVFVAGEDLARTLSVEGGEGEDMSLSSDARCVFAREKSRLVGCADGTIVSLSAESKPTYHNLPASITNVCCCSKGKTIFATTLAEIVAVSGSRLDDRGCDPKCASVLLERLCVARRDGITLYSSEEKLGFYAIDGDKSAVACLGNLAAVSSRHDKSRRSEVHVYDLEKSRVSHFHRLQAGQSVACLAARSGGGGVAVVASGGCLSLLREIETHDKLQVLYRMNLYPTAVDVATTAGLSPGEVMDIYAMYGDHLYKKCDWAGAAEQYSRAIGRLEPSYVVSRFLEAQRLHNLADYLETWHRKSSPTSRRVPELTALLVNCYAKLKDVSKLDALASGQLDDLGVDGPVAVESLAKAGYAEHALQLAARRDEHLSFARLAARRLDEALFDHLEKVEDRELQAEVLLKYGGKKLVDAYPEKSTEVLMRVLPPDPRRFVQLFVDRPKYLRYFLEFVKRDDPETWTRHSAELSATLLELALDDWRRCADDGTLTEDDPFNLAQQHNQQPSSSTYEDRLRYKADECVRLLEDGGYEPTTAVVLVESRDFERGRLYLLENNVLGRTGLVDAVLLQTYGDQGRVDMMLRVARRSPNATLLWQELVNRTVTAVPAPGSDAFFDKCDDLQKVLRAVLDDAALKPARCLEACSANPNVPLFALKPFLSRLLAKSRDATLKTRASVAELRASTEPMRQGDRLAHLMLQATLLNDEDERHDDDDDDDDAGRSRGERSKWHEIKRSQRATAHDHELFFKQLEDPDRGGFDTIATYFGKGVVR